MFHFWGFPEELALKIHPNSLPILPLYNFKKISSRVQFYHSKIPTNLSTYLIPYYKDIHKNSLEKFILICNEKGCKVQVMYLPYLDKCLSFTLVFINLVHELSLKFIREEKIGF